MKEGSHKIFSETKEGVDSAQNFEDQWTTEILCKVYSYLGVYLNVSLSVFYFVIY